MKIKKLLCAALALTLLLALGACGNKSGEGSSPTDVKPGSSPTDVDVPATPTPEPQSVSTLTLCGIPVVMNGQPTGVGYKGVTYADGVLTIGEGVTMESNSAQYPCIDFSGELEIVVEGDCTLSSTGGAPAISGGREGDSDASDLTISGSGKLTAAAADAAGIAVTGKLSVSDGALDITGAPAAQYGELLLGGLSKVTDETDTHFAIDRTKE